MPFSSQDNAALVRTELDSVFFQTFETVDSSALSHFTVENGSIFKVVPTTMGYYIHEVNAPTGLWKQLGSDIEPLPEHNPTVGYKNIVKVLDWGDSIWISKNLFDDNQHNVWQENVREFSLMGRVSQDSNAMGMFRSAFTTVLCPDGVAWFSASHLTLSGDTVSNLVTGALTTTTLNTAMTSLREQKGQNGVIRGSVAKYLIVPTALLKTAIEITDSVLIADTANNAVNFYRSALGLVVLTSPYLGSAAGGSNTAWFLLSEFHGLRRVVRAPITTSLVSWEYDPMNARRYKYSGFFREALFVADYAGAVASTGV